MLVSSVPPDAVVLFDGQPRGWRRAGGGPPRWRIEDGILLVAPGTGDIVTEEVFQDFYLHVEFRCPSMPEKSGQQKGNSGVYLQGRYEIQILDSFGVAVPGSGDCGAVYQQYAPLTNASLPAMEWQSYDAAFRGARGSEAARLTLFQNGRVVHNNVSLQPTKGALDDHVTEPGPVRLQDHGDLVAFRNLWLVPLSSPRQVDE